MPSATQGIQHLKYAMLENLVIAAIVIIFFLMLKYYLSRFIDNYFSKKRKKRIDLESSSSFDKILSKESNIVDANVAKFLSKKRVTPKFEVNLELNKWSLLLLQELEWRRFEEVCGLYFNSIGYQSRLNNFGADGGVDIRLFKNDHLLAFVQCKAYSKNNIVGVSVVREFVGVLFANKVNFGFIITTNTFSSDAISFVRTLKSQDNIQIELIDGQEFLKHIFALSNDNQKKLLEFAISGDYSTPTCVKCGSKMVKRINKKDGNVFWGCANYPKCHNIMNCSN